MLTLDGYLLAPRREQFSLAVDTYETWSLLLPRSGAFAFEVTGVPRGVATFGDIVICPPGGALRRRMQLPTAFLHARFSTELAPPAGRTRLHDLDRLRADLEMLDDHTEVIATHIVTDLVLMALRAHREVPGDELVRQATAYLHDHFTSPDLSLGDLADLLGISPAQLSRRFKATHGVTPVHYLRRTRVRKARELLTETNETLRTIAERCGYRSSFYLSRVFTNQTGQSPSHYRHTTRV
ncbi:transcriptional regulator GlxA family with amidase domain [Kribbella aluminosa]|uniref:Transcriptional regulator GlxA family with amidase domain n=1 Tax=Kribbella aluminosa TaxID=416017 RepID=A0ABS4ULN4_9ACTN|nr:AraC family transcriptional regulator [Kribbella aluminosa]MBP2352563.1 transcriptional regulator GlxA family with amidase domain [Kribbella aluminosa]